jgi:hypothetical protein
MKSSVFSPYLIHGSFVVPHYFKIISICSLLFFHSLSVANTVAELEKESLKGLQESTSIQNEIDRLYSEEQLLDQQYQTLLMQLAALKSYNLDVKKRIDSQNSQLLSLQEQLASVAQVKLEIMPLMQQMQTSLAAFVDADLPFKTEQRAQELERLAQSIDDIEMPLSSKYQRILEAFDEQRGLSQSMESFQGMLSIDGQQVQVDFLRLGRVALFYQTLDGQKSGRWSKENGSWQLLDGEQSKQLSKALEVAQGSKTPSLLMLDVGKLQSSDLARSGSESQ